MTVDCRLVFADSAHFLSIDCLGFNFIFLNSQYLKLRFPKFDKYFSKFAFFDCFLFNYFKKKIKNKLSLAMFYQFKIRDSFQTKIPFRMNLKSNIAKKNLTVLTIITNSFKYLLAELLSWQATSSPANTCCHQTLR